MKRKNNSSYPKRKSSPQRRPLDKRKAPIYSSNPNNNINIQPTTSFHHHQHHQPSINDPPLLNLLPCYVGFDMMEKLQVEYQSQRHQQLQHYPQENPNSNDKSECPRCLKRLEIPRNMKRHLESHEGNGRPHLCSVCDKSFKQASHAKAHLSVHGEGDVPSGDMMACPVCFTEFKHGRNFKRHMLIHDGAKPFSCDLCGRRFRQAIHLKTHLTSHSNVKPFSCQTCGKNFSRIDNLRRHQLIHSGLKPFTCHCGKGYTQSHHLKSHVTKCNVTNM